MKKVRKYFNAIGNALKKAWVSLSKFAEKVFNPNPTPGLRKVSFYTSYFIGLALKFAGTLVLLIICTGIILVTYGAIFISKNLDVGPPVMLEEFDPSLTTVINVFDPETGEYIQDETMSGSENRLWASYDEIPDNIKNGFIAIEDRKFWEHNGVDWKRTIAAFVNMFWTMKNNFGGSTITQQLIKNGTQNDEATVERKLQEIFQALEFEKRYSKKNILENYINTIFLGEKCYGIKTAAAEYFGKNLDELSLAECASLVGITNNPYLYNPYYFPKNNKSRQETILGAMYDQGYITENEYLRAKAEKLTFARSDKTQSVNIHSWYNEQIFKDLTKDLMELYGWQESMAQQYIYSGGLTIYSEQDTKVQKSIEEVWYNDANWPTDKDPEKPQSTIVVMDQSNGAVKGLIGNRFVKEGDLLTNMATMTYRQPGSSFKPIAVYSPLFEYGFITPYSPILDAPIELLNNRAWPRNSPVGYEGNISILTAVTKSKNTAAIRLLDMLTVEKSREFAISRFKISTIVETPATPGGNADYRASMAFGALTKGASVLEMTAAYCVFPTGGIYTKPRTYSKVFDKNGELIIDNQPKQSVAVKTKTAFYMLTCLKSVVTSGTGTKAKWGDMPIAGKTGTTSDDNDRWFCGFSPYYTSACWFGYEMPRSLKGYTSSNPALLMWKQVMQKIHDGLPVKDFDVPQDLVSAQYCIDSGKKPTAACALDNADKRNRIATGTYDIDDVPKEDCDVHSIVSLCTISGHLARPDCPAATNKNIALVYSPLRGMPEAGIKIDDEQYTLRTWGSPAYLLDEKQFAPYSDSTYYNTFCNISHNTGEG